MRKKFFYCFSLFFSTIIVPRTGDRFSPRCACDFFPVDLFFLGAAIFFCSVERGGSPPDSFRVVEKKSTRRFVVWNGVFFLVVVVVKKKIEREGERDFFCEKNNELVSKNFFRQRVSPSSLSSGGEMIFSTAVFSFFSGCPRRREKKIKKMKLIFSRWFFLVRRGIGKRIFLVVSKKSCFFL